MPWAMRSGAGAASAVAQASRCARTPSALSFRSRRTVALGGSGVAEYGPAHGDQAKGIPLRHLHDAVRADIDVLS